VWLFSKAVHLKLVSALYVLQQLNPSKKSSDSNELEHLKFQIYKWINKLVGEDNNETLQHAEELWTKIKSLQVPVLLNPEIKTTCLFENGENNITRSNVPHQ